MEVQKLIELLALLEQAGKPEQQIQESQVNEKHMIGEYVIVRCRDAGVHAGTLVSYEGREVVLENARRLWYWKAAGNGHTLNAVAEFGLEDSSKIPTAVLKIVLPEACEIIATSKVAEESIKGIASHEVD